MDPDEWLGMQQQRLQQTKGSVHEIGIGRRRHACRADLKTARSEDAASKRPMGGLADHEVEGLARSPKPRSK
jgi:hypothetical protein